MCFKSIINALFVNVSFLSNKFSIGQLKARRSTGEYDLLDVKGVLIKIDCKN